MGHISTLLSIPHYKCLTRQTKEIVAKGKIKSHVNFVDSGIIIFFKSLSSRVDFGTCYPTSVLDPQCSECESIERASNVLIQDEKSCPSAY